MALTDAEMTDGTEFEIRPDPEDARWHFVFLRVPSGEGQVQETLKKVRGARAQDLTIQYLLASTLVVCEGTRDFLASEASAQVQLGRVIDGLRLLQRFFARIQAADPPKNPEH